jgi:hypothetical protein
MMAVLQVDNQMLNSAKLVSLPSRSQLSLELLQDWVIDRAIADIALTPQEQSFACEQLYARRHLKTPERLPTPLISTALSEEQWLSLALRLFKIEKFKQLTWGTQVKAEFLRRNCQLDTVLLQRSIDQLFRDWLKAEVAQLQVTFPASQNLPTRCISQLGSPTALAGGGKAGSGFSRVSVYHGEDR